MCASAVAPPVASPAKRMQNEGATEGHAQLEAGVRCSKCRHPHERQPELLARVAARQVAQHIVVVVADDAQDDVRRADALRALRLQELAQPLHLPRRPHTLSAGRLNAQTLRSTLPHTCKPITAGLFRVQMRCVGLHPTVRPAGGAPLASAGEAAVPPMNNSMPKALFKNSSQRAPVECPASRVLQCPPLLSRRAQSHTRRCPGPSRRCRAARRA